MTPFGPDPINLRCPHCHVYALDGYMSHKTGCPERERERQIREHMLANPPSQGMETEDEGRGEIWGEFIWAWLVWHWRQINWAKVALVIAAIGIALLIFWLGLEAIEGNE